MGYEVLCMRRVEGPIAKDMQERWSGDTGGCSRILRDLWAVFSSVGLRIDTHTPSSLGALLLSRLGCCYAVMKPRRQDQRHLLRSRLILQWNL